MPHGHGIGATNSSTSPSLTATCGGDLDGLFESQGDEAGEEEGAEGVDVEGYEVLGDGGAGGAWGWVDENGFGVGGGVPGEAEEESEGEEGVHVDDAV